MKKTILQRYFHWLHGQWPSGTVEPLPEVRSDGSTEVPGLYVTGDLTGVPLLKFAIESGVRAVNAIRAEPAFSRLRVSRIPDIYPLVIVGAGVSGMAAAKAAKDAGIDYAIIEKHQAFSTVVDFPKGKPIFTLPEDMEPEGSFQVQAKEKETLLVEMQTQTAEIPIHPGHVVEIKRGSEYFILLLEDGQEIKGHRIILAIGRTGIYRKLGIPGEELDKVYFRLHDPHDFVGKNVLVVGGGDTAVEASIALVQAGANVTVSYRQSEFSRAKSANIATLYSLLGQTSGRGTLTLLLKSQVQKILPDQVLIKDQQDRMQAIPNHFVFVMIGREAPLSLLRKTGVRIRGDWTKGRVVRRLLFVMMCAVILNIKSGGSLSKWVQAHNWFPYSISQGLKQIDSPPNGSDSRCSVFPGCFKEPTSFLGVIAVSAESPSFWYTLTYSGLVIGFGIRRMRRRATPYVRWQTLALILVQVGPLFLLPEVILPFLGHHGWLPTSLANAFFPIANYGHGREYWRAYGLILAWPLFIYNIFTTQPLWGWLIISLVQTFVILPIIIYFYGKGSYCGWICSCGALAETLGDDHRKKMPHGPKYNRLNMAGQIILAIAFLLLFVRIVGWVFPSLGVDRFFAQWAFGEGKTLLSWFSYKWVVDIFLAGTIGLGLYFWFSGRVWCRFFCPLAALMHIYARFSRFRIFADKKKCISCNVCTDVCHMGIDIMSVANKGIPMQDPECVRCSACVQSCPTGVLSFGQADSHNQPRSYDRLPASLFQIRSAQKKAESSSKVLAPE